MRMLKTKVRPIRDRREVGGAAGDRGARLLGPHGCGPGTFKLNLRRDIAPLRLSEQMSDPKQPLAVFGTRSFLRLEQHLSHYRQNRVMIEVARVTNFGSTTMTCWPCAAPGSLIAT
jgi:hypothetical protein